MLCGGQQFTIGFVVRKRREPRVVLRAPFKCRAGLQCFGQGDGARVEAVYPMGPVAEDEVLALIDTDSRREVVNVLAKIGTKKSADAIRRHITEFDTFGHRDAINAIKEIEQRD